jgi:hypothetical protein
MVLADMGKMAGDLGRFAEQIKGAIKAVFLYFVAQFHRVIGYP